MVMESVEQRRIRRFETPPQETYMIDSKENVRFNLSAAALRQAKTFVALIENMCPEVFRNEPIRCETITTSTMELVVQWLEHHKNDGPPPSLETRHYQNLVIPEWDNEFLTKLNNGQLFDILCAANYLDIQRLMDYGCKTVANMASGKTTEEMRVLFGIQSDEEVAEAALFEPGPSSR